MGTPTRKSTKRTMSNKDKMKEALFNKALKKASKGKKESRVLSDKDMKGSKGKKESRVLSDKDMKGLSKMNRGGKAKMNRGGDPMMVGMNLGGESKKRGMARGCGVATKGKGFNQ